jgi:hypothetical protein
VSQSQVVPNYEDIRWYPNSLRNSRLATDRLLMRIAIASAILAIAGLATALLSRVTSGVPGLVGTAGTGLFVLSVLGLLVSLMQFTPRFSGTRAWYAPIRVGFSSRGLHVEYDPKSQRLRRREAMSFIPWDSFDGIAPPISPYMRQDIVIFQSYVSPNPEIVSISDELVGRIKDEVKEHSNVLGPE